MHPTVRAVGLFGAGVPLAIVVVIASEGLWPLWFGYLAALVVAIGVDAALCLPARRLCLHVESPGLLYVGGKDVLVVRIDAGGWSRAVSLEILCDFGPELSPQPSQTVVWRGPHPVAVSFELEPLRRGKVSVNSVWARWSGPFGLVRRQVIRSGTTPIPVVPNARAVRRAAVRFFSRDAPFGQAPQRQGGEGSEFESLREYRPGLDPRTIDWKHSARHHALLCKEFRTERNHQIVVAFDTGYLMSEPIQRIPKLDHAINAGLMLAYLAIRNGDRVGIFGFDAKVRLFVEPRAGRGCFQRIEQASAELRYSHEETNFTLALADLALRLRRRSLVVILTDFIDTITASLMVESIERLRRRHLVAFVSLQDPQMQVLIDAPPTSLRAMATAVVASDVDRERVVVLERLSLLGVHTLVVPPGGLSTRLLNRYLHIKQRELI